MSSGVLATKAAIAVAVAGGSSRPPFTFAGASGVTAGSGVPASVLGDAGALTAWPGVRPSSDRQESRSGARASDPTTHPWPLVGFRPHRPARAWVERRAGRLLREIRRHELYRPLGFVRLGDYVHENLGISYRGAQELMRADEALESLPLAAAAFMAGEITSGHIRVVSRVASPDTSGTGSASPGGWG